MSALQEVGKHPKDLYGDFRCLSCKHRYVVASYPAGATPEQKLALRSCPKCGRTPERMS